MSLQAVGWLSSKLGINIDGRTDASEDKTTEALSHHAFAGTAAKFDMCLHKINDAVFGRDNENNASSGGGGESVLAGINTSSPGNGDEVELDENGLPISKNWYYFDKELNRWNVSPDAPAHIKQEYEHRLKEEEDEREGRNVPPPPPPPPPPMSMPGGRAPMYASSGHFPHAATPQQGVAHPQGLFGTPSAGGHSQHRPQYAVPNYFETAKAPMNTAEAPQFAQQQSPLEQTLRQQQPQQQQMPPPPTQYQQHMQYHQEPQQYQQHTLFPQQHYKEQLPSPGPQFLPPPPRMGYTSAAQSQALPSPNQSSLPSYQMQRPL
ncbi:hypothetical protein DQ04_02451080 [Trypanosoma grayi]|uniref:hypothetical protein n=1 Tax=Trypanosoma grayi TaxID=71804 RepID=UPI0004F3F375|nr:hypothetical protein DQ04_02451080 [Trypanosoma grayi]KEG11606.1 hypothetical protein DQ04_02451080 [Trypanosoma grayi]